jgi:hypothetical protein
MANPIYKVSVTSEVRYSESLCYSGSRDSIRSAKGDAPAGAQNVWSLALAGFRC